MRILTVLFLATAFVTTSIERAVAGTPGVNGSLTVSASGTVLNLYDVAVSASGRTIVATNIANLQSTALGNVVPGSVLLVYQAQGATIDSTNTVTYGNVTAYNNAGYYEFVTVGSVSGNTITIAASCNALAHTYAATTQIVRVPQYSSLTISSGASVTAPTWNGATGGIVALDVSGALSVSGSIAVTGLGFRGAIAYSNSGSSFQQNVTSYVTGQTGAQLAAALAAEKGESIAGNGTAYDASFGGRYGRGAPANGGGGGDGHNAGGGGGSNGDNGLTWSGQGLEDATYDAYYSDANGQNPYGAADPGYSTMKSGSGGGRGGYTFGYPGGGDDGRRPVGGLGGRPMNYSGGAASRVFFGGGGGAGDANNNEGGSGGNGGGIVLLNVGSLGGAGSIAANGAAGGASGVSDAPGGAGGGGAVVVLTGSGSVAAINANGGGGGSQPGGGGEAEGPGGGGGGGYVAAPASTITTTGGAEGTTAGPTSITNGFLPYGATLGTSGETAAAPSSFVFCFTPVIGSAKAATIVNNGDGSYAVTFSVVIENYGDTPLTGLAAVDPLSTTFPSGTTYSVVTAPAVSSVTSGASATTNAAFNGNTQTSFVTAGTLPMFGIVTVTFTVKVIPPVGSQTYSNSAGVAANGSTGNANGVSTSDVSDSGTNPDPAGLGLPNQTSENVATPITITGQPNLLKTVRNVTTNEATGLTADTASPGDQLEYTLSFTNGTGGPLSSFTITDSVPAHTTYKSAACGALPAGVTACTPTFSAGVVTYHLTGTLNSGSTQTFLLDVTVN